MSVSDVFEFLFKRDLSNGYTYAEILHVYFPQNVNMFSFINARSLIKQYLKKKNLPITNETIDATIHGKDGGAENLLEQTYRALTNKKYV
jgi:hypothetical protein